MQDGLASPIVHSIFQDKDGFLWIGTESGLCRYDGTRFKTFTVKDGLPSNEVFGMFQDSKGRIWLQQYKNTIAYLFNGKIHNQQNDTVLKKVKLTYRLYGIAEDADGNIGFCEEPALHIIIDSNKTIRTINTVNDIPIPIFSLAADHKKRFILSSDRDLYRVENFQLKHLRNISPLPGIWSNTVLLTPNYVAYGFSDILYIYLKDTMILQRLPIRQILKFSAISDSVFSVNTSNGGLLLNVNDRSTIRILPGIKVSNTFLDKENNLWIGTIGSGLYKLSSQMIVNRKIDENQNDVCYITKEDNKIIIGNNNSRIYEFTHGRFIHKQAYRLPKWELTKVFYYEKLKTNNYLIGHGLGLTNYKNGHQDTIYSVMSKQVTAFNDSSILMAAHAGLYHVRKNDLRVLDTIWKRKTLCALRTGDSILIGTVAGLFVLKKASNKWYIADSLMSSSIIAYIKRAANNLIWVCTYEDGLYCFAKGKMIKHFSDTNGLPSNNGRSLYLQHNDVWLGTDKGLVKIYGTDKDFLLQKYSVSEGLPSNNINSIFVDGSTVYIGTPEGLCYFEEKKIGTSSMCSLVLIGVVVGDSAMNLRDHYYIHRNQRFVVEFAGISFRSEKEMSFYYKLNGIDKTWRTTTATTLEFTSLPYGKYELEIIAINKFGKESLPVKIQFTIIQPFYKTNWFLLLLVLLIIAAVLFWHNRWLNLKKQKQLRKLEQEIKILELEQMALRAQMNPHFIFNCINAMQQLIMEKNVDDSTRFIDSFSALVRQTLDNAAELSIPLREEIKFLSSYFELERIRLEDLFSYTIDTTGIEEISRFRIPNMVVQPFVENAIKHGIRYKKDGKGHIEVRFMQQDNLLRCTITDNGIGREKAGQLQKNAASAHTSKGMSITFKRIDSLVTITRKKISIVVQDLKDEQSAALGTSVIIDFQT